MSSIFCIIFVILIVQICVTTVIMFLISWVFTIVSLALASLLYYYVSIKGKGGDWGDGFKSAYFQLALRSLRTLGGESMCINVLELTA
jgi:ABC-type multidrug transport system fused ATPase/permease subunit